MKWVSYFYGSIVYLPHERRSDFGLRISILRRFMTLILTASALGAHRTDAAVAVDIGSRRELFVDHHLIDKLDGVSLKLHEPSPGGVAIKYDKPWEDTTAFYSTVLKDGDVYRMYYRGSLAQKPHMTCYAESPDGVHWTKPNLGLVKRNGTSQNNIILPTGLQFTPFLDTRPGVPADERFKANVRDGRDPNHLIGYVSGDGIRWHRLRDEPLVRMQLRNNFDSQNVMFWSEVENCYVLYARHAEGGRRATARATSKDFLNWSEQVLMSYSDTNSTTPSQHLYTNQTQPYFRAPHIYISLPGRIHFGRRTAMTTEEVQFYDRRVASRAGGAMDVSDGVLLTTRAATERYDFTFKESFIRPGIGHGNWTSRTNYPACGIVPTASHEMSLYVQRDYAQETARLERMTLRVDGFASVHAPYRGGQMVTTPVTFSGNKLEINYATSAAGSIRVEIQDAAGKPIPGYTLEECPEIIGDQIRRIVAWGVVPPPLNTGTNAESLEQESPNSIGATVVPWTGRSNVGELAGKPIRLCFVMHDADLYSLRFAAYEEAQGSTDQDGDARGVQVRVAAISYVPKKFDLEANAARLERGFRAAKTGGAQIAVAPEGALDGYVVMDIIDGKSSAKKMNDVAVSLDHPVIQRFRALARELRMCLVFGFAERIGDNVFNSAVFIDDRGAIRGKQHKMCFAEGYHPSWWFNRLGLHSRAFDTPLGRCGILICNDRWEPDLARIPVLDGARFLIIPAMGNTSKGNDDAVLSRSRENGVPVVEANVGVTLVVDNGRIVALDRKEEGITFAEITIPPAVEPSPVQRDEQERQFLRWRDKMMPQRYQRRMEVRQEKNKH